MWEFDWFPELLFESHLFFFFLFPPHRQLFQSNPITKKHLKIQVELKRVDCVWKTEEKSNNVYFYWEIMKSGNLSNSNLPVALISPTQKITPHFSEKKRLFGAKCPLVWYILKQ